MGELRDDKEQRKRKIAPVPYNDSSKQYAFRNDFATYAASATDSAPAYSSGLPKDAYSPDEGDGHDPKKFKSVDGSYRAHLSASATLKTDSFSSLSAPSSPKKGAQDISGPPGFSTPPANSGKFYQSCPSSTSSISPSSVLSSQDSMNSTAFGPSASVPSSANRKNSWNPREDVSHGDQLDLVMAQRLFERSATKGIFNNLKTNLQPILVKRLKELSQLKPTIDVGLEMADSAYLLKLLNSSNPKFETVGKKAGKGAMLLQEGMRLIEQGQEALRSAILELSTPVD